MRAQIHAVTLNLPVNGPLIVSGLCWIVAYIFAIREGFRAKTYCIPTFAVFLNFTWELFFALDCPFVPACTVTNPAACLCPDITGLSRVILWGWVAFDVLIVYQVLRYGREREPIPEIKRFFSAIAASMVVFAFILQWAFITYYHDRAGVVDAFMINLVMSISFIYLLISRPDLNGLPTSVAWFKMFGTTLASIGFCIMKPFPFPGQQSDAFVYVLFGGNFLFDMAYIFLLTNRRRQLMAANVATAGATA